MLITNWIIISLNNSDNIPNKAIEPKKRQPAMKIVVLTAIVDKGSFKYFLKIII